MAPLPGLGRDALLSPCSMESGAISSVADMAHDDGGRLESPCPSSAGLSPPNAPPLTLREKRDVGELAAQAQSPEVWGSLLPWQPRASPVPPLPSPHLSRSD